MQNDFRYQNMKIRYQNLILELGGRLVRKETGDKKEKVVTRYSIEC